MERDLTTGSVFKTVIYFSLPYLLSYFLQTLYGMADLFIVGQFGGVSSTTAVSIGSQIMHMLTVMIVGLAMGATVMIGRCIGAKDYKKASETIGNTATMFMGIAIILMIVLLAAVRPIVSVMSTPAEAVEGTIRYLTICFIGIPFITAYNIISAIFRGIGDSKSPMYFIAVACAANIGLDYLFIFVLKRGMFGAALATSLGYIVGALMILIYLMQPHRVLHLCKVKLSSKSLRLTLRNTGYMCKLGLSSFLCEAAIATMMFTGNYVFIHYLGEDGVAAYSIACYFFPIIFMVYNAIAQSAQPILSYNFGAGNPERVRAAFRLALLTAISCGVVVFAVTALFSAQITSWFIDSSYPAHDLAVKGLPLFASGFVCFGINIVSIGYFQSVERDRPAMAITLLRGFILILFCFWLMPILWGVPGIWLAVPVSELLTFLFVITIYCHRKRS